MEGFVIDWLCLGLTTSTLVGHFVLPPREWEKKDGRGDEIERQGRKRNRNEREEIKAFPSSLTCYKNSKPWPIVSQYELDALVTQDTRHFHYTRPPRERLCAMMRHMFTSWILSPTCFKHGTLWLEIVSANHSTTWTIQTEEIEEILTLLLPCICCKYTDPYHHSPSPLHTAKIPLLTL